MSQSVNNKNPIDPNFFKIKDYFYSYEELPGMVLQDRHPIIEKILGARREYKKLKYYFEDAEISEKHLSFLIFNSFLSEGNLYGFINWLARGPLYCDQFFSYKNVFEFFFYKFFYHATVIHASVPADLPGDFEELPSFIIELFDHWNFWMDILLWSEKLFWHTTYDLRFAKGGPAWDIPVLSLGDKNR